MSKYKHEMLTGEDPAEDMYSAIECDEFLADIEPNTHEVRLALKSRGRAIAYIIIPANDAVEVGLSVQAAGIEVGGTRAPVN